MEATVIGPAAHADKGKRMSIVNSIDMIDMHDTRVPTKLEAVLKWSRMTAEVHPSCSINPITDRYLLPRFGPSFYSFDNPATQAQRKSNRHTTKLLFFLLATRTQEL